MELVLLIGLKKMNFGGSFKSVNYEPSASFSPPLVKFVLGHGICETSCNKVSDLALPPVRQVASMNSQLIMRTKESGFGFSRIRGRHGVFHDAEFNLNAAEAAATFFRPQLIPARATALVQVYAAPLAPDRPAA